MKKHDAATKIVNAITPVDQSAAANTQGDWVHLALYDSLTVIYQSDVGTSGQDPTVALRQATSPTGTGGKALTGVTWYHSQAANLATFEGFTAADDSVADAGETACIARVEVTADQLDVADGYAWAQVRVSRGGNTAGKLIAASYALRGARYALAVPDQPSVTA